MGPSLEMREALDRFFKWTLTNVSELENPVLIVLDYSPQDDGRPLSIAYDYTNGPKCWLSETKVRDLDSTGPNPNSNYRQFAFEGRRFYPYSIVPLSTTVFEDIEEFRSACLRLYHHIDWG